MMNSAGIKDLTSENISFYLKKLMDIEKQIEWSPWNEENFLKEIPAKWNLSFVYECADKVLGFAILSQKSPGCIHLHRLVVSPESQGTGIGKKMLKEMFLRCQTQRIKFLSLYVPRNNEIAIKFYEAEGFVTLFSEVEKLFKIKYLD